MAKQGPGRAAMRPGSKWQPVVGRRLNRGVAVARPKRRVAGRRQLQLPRVEVPHISVAWRRIIGIVIIAGLAGFGGWWVYQSPLLSVRSVAVDGNGVLTDDVVRSVAGLDGDSLIQPDLEGARARLLALPNVKDVQLTRDWPAGVHIAIVERLPWGVWQAGGQTHVIDAEGVVLDLPPPAGAPVVVQTDAPATPLAPGDTVDVGTVAVARELVSTAEQTVGRQVLSLEFSQATGLTAVLSGDLRVVFGDVQGYEFKIAALYAVLEQAQAAGKELHRIDLRFGDRVAVQ